MRLRFHSSFVALLLTAGAVSFAIVPAQAQVNFNGAAMTLFHDSPNVGTHLENRSIIVGPGTEAFNVVAGYNLDVSATNLLVTFTHTGNWNPGTFNGLVLFDSNNVVPTITGVSIASTNSPFDASRLSFDADNVYMNFASLPTVNGQTVNVQVAFAGSGVAAPEPATLTLLAMGLLPIAGAATWRKRRAAAVR